MRFACKLARRGQGLKFVLQADGNTEKYTNKDPTLIQVVARALLWWEWIRDGQVQSLTEVATREGLDKAQVTRRLRLAFLSPKLVGDLLSGSQTPELTPETLLRKIDLPLSWTEQESLLS